MSIYGFLGCGNMGGALARAAAKKAESSLLLVSGKNPEKARAFAAELGCAATDNLTLAKKSRFLFLGVKPQNLPDVMKEIAPVLQARKDRFCLVSMAAGVSIGNIRQMVGCPAPVIRIMPNTPVLIGRGMTVYALSPEVSGEEEAEFLSLLSEAGRFDRLEENKIDAAGALSGCGPAYAYLFLEALADGAVECGLPREKAELYAAQTLLGSAGMVLETGKKPGALKDAVCSPGGTTIAGVHALEQDGFRAAAMDAVTAAYEKTKKLAESAK